MNLPAPSRHADQAVAFQACVAALIVICRLAAGFCLLIATFSTAAQQPFVTDDAAVTERGTMTVELSTDFNRLQPQAFPDAYQNGASFTLSFGLFKRLDVSVSGAHIALVRAGRRTQIVGGVGDTNFSAKYNFRSERPNSRLPAMSLSVTAYFPTGSSRRGFGNGLYGLGINGIAEKTIRKRNTLRANLGFIAAGGLNGGDVGIATGRRRMFRAGISFVRQFGEKWLLGGEIVGAISDKFVLSAGLVQTRWGGNYRLSDRSTLDFGATLGRFAASPRVGFIIGYSRDIKLWK